MEKKIFCQQKIWELVIFVYICGQKYKKMDYTQLNRTRV